ncbi:MAG: MBL fold metallo-hydrolase [Bacteroidales bacterium]|nr:MBL fold metallo-hydrolase [Bacteroidales bacterium]
MKIKFLGAAREVTGSKHLITTGQGKKILLDCGMFQGKGMETDAMNRNLGFDPSEIDHIILTHAHIDHSGLIPFVYKLGFRGSVICTNATRDLCAIMLADSGHIQEHDVKWFNKRRTDKGLDPVEPIYTESEAKLCMELFIGIAYNRKLKIDENTTVKFINTGHMLGSGVAFLEITENGITTRLAYTGDIGRPENRILKSPQPFPQCDYLITESTYGNRLHPKMQEAETELLRVIRETCVEKGGKVIIPSFAIGRTQEVVYALNNFFNEGKLPKINIYVDSPLAVNATEIFRMHTDNLNDDVHDVMIHDSDPFGFGSLFYLKRPEESKRLNSNKNPCVIISASGMMEAGRIKHHLANNIENPLNTILAVGYCSPSTLGARILSGTDMVSIFGVKHPVRATVERIEAFSGHGDYQEMIDYLGCQDPKQIKQVFLVHGEYESQEFYSRKLYENGFRQITIPAAGTEINL